MLEGQIPRKPLCSGLFKGYAGACYKHKSSTLSPQDGRTSLIKPLQLWSLFRGKAGSGVQFLHTTGKGRWVHLPCQDPGISVLEVCFLHHMLTAVGRLTFPPKAECCTCAARAMFSTMPESRTQPRVAWPIFCRSFMISQTDLGQWWMLLHLYVERAALLELWSLGTLEGTMAS